MNADVNTRVRRLPFYSLVAVYRPTRGVFRVGSSSVCPDPSRVLTFPWFQFGCALIWALWPLGSREMIAKCVEDASSGEGFQQDLGFTPRYGPLPAGQKRSLRCRRVVRAELGMERSSLVSRRSFIDWPGSK